MDTQDSCPLHQDDQLEPSGQNAQDEGGLGPTSERLVAAITMMPSFPSKPIHLNQSWLRVLFTFIISPPRPTPPLTSNSIDLIDKDNGWCCFLASSNRERTRLAPTPTNISTKCGLQILKSGTPASLPATALASNVLPVPGETFKEKEHLLQDTGLNL